MMDDSITPQTDEPGWPDYQLNIRTAYRMTKYGTIILFDVNSEEVLGEWMVNISLSSIRPRFDEYEDYEIKPFVVKDTGEDKRVGEYEVTE